jgi:xanthine dehydrogenase accessory factor
MDYSFPKLLETLIAGLENGLALATVVEAEGSTPQVVGSSAIFSEIGLVAGTVGGGLLEGRVEAAAGQALADGKARLLTVRLDADPTDTEGAICGGAVRVLVDPSVGRDRAVFEAALDGLHRRRSGYLIAEIKTSAGGSVDVERFWVPADEIAQKTPDVLAAVAIDGFAEDLTRHPALAKGGDRLAFVELVQPLPRLIIAGAGHIGRAVARLGSLLDFNVTVVDDRPEFANKANVPEADEIVVGEIGGSLGRIEPSTRDYFIIVTRGHQKDAEALRAVIGRPSSYIGMIGSSSKIETMGREFLKNGWATAEQWAGIHAPIGLRIGSRTVDEIAVSIAAELVLVRSQRKAEGFA